MKTILSLLTCMLLAISVKSEACTRVMYKGKENIILTARSMDWQDDLLTNLWILPRGIKRNGETGKNTVHWEAKYGSVIAAAYDIASTDGMNEKGLVANLLWLSESEYPKWDKDGKKPGLSISIWAQYVLDNFATVAEAVAALENEPFIVVSANVPGQPDKFTTLHMSISDSSGDNAIFEYVDGKLVIHHDKSYQTMTNSPLFNEQLTLNSYWEKIGGTVMLPGTNRAADRFVRASFYTHAVPVTDNIHIATAAAFSIIRNCSVPYGISTPKEPNISSTIWRTLSDQKNLIYYFDSALTPNVFWVPFSQVDFTKGAPVKVLTLTNKEIYSGSTVKDFKESAPFKFEGIN